MRYQDEDTWDEFKDPELVDWKRVRAAIEHENQLTNHRFTWLLTSQGFLFAGFTLVFQASTKKDVQEAAQPFYWGVMAALAVTGIFAAMFLRLALRAAENQHELLRQWWEYREKNAKRHPPICGYFPTLYLKLPYSTFPIVFVVAWLMLTAVALWTLISAYAARIGIAMLGLAVIAGLISIGFMLGRKTKQGELRPEAAQQSAAPDGAPSLATLGTAPRG